jgi:hypothetical protein
MPITKERLLVSFKSKRSGARPQVLKKLPEEFKTREIYLLAVKYWKYYYEELFTLIPKNILNDPDVDFYYEAVKTAGDALFAVPYKRQTKKMSRAAVKQCGFALQYVARQFLDAKICLDAVKNCGRALRYVPARFITADLCQAAVNSDTWALEFVPAGFQTAKMCMNAVTNPASRKPPVHEIVRESADSEVACLLDESYYPLINFVAEQYRTPELEEANKIMEKNNDER